MFCGGTDSCDEPIPHAGASPNRTRSTYSNSIRVTGYGHYLWGEQHIRSQEVSNTKDVSC